MLTRQSNLSCEQVASSCPTLPQPGEKPLELAQAEPEEYPQNPEKASALNISPEYLVLVALCAAGFCLMKSGIIQVTWINFLSFCYFINHHQAYVIFGAIVIGMIAGACWYMIYDAAHELDADIAKENKNRWRLVDDKFADCQRCAHRTPNHEGRGHTCPHSSTAAVDDIAAAYEKQFCKNFFELQLEARTNKSYIWSEAIPPSLQMTRKAKTHFLKQVRAENVWLRYRLGKCQECWHYWDCAQPGPKNDKPFHIRIGTKNALEERVRVLKTRPVANSVPVDHQTRKIIRMIEQTEPENPMLNDVLHPPSDEELEQRHREKREADYRAEIAAFEQAALEEGRHVSAPRQSFDEYTAQLNSVPASAKKESGPPIALSTERPQTEPEKRGRGRPRKYPKDPTLA